jgi:hypothetical protein
MNIRVYQEDIAYCYECDKRCSVCVLRYVCFTHKNEDGILKLQGCPSLDYLVVLARVKSATIKQVGILCPLCRGLSDLEICIGYGNVCRVCGHFLTCNICNVDNCEFRGDLYNTDGDCLMEK